MFVAAPGWVGAASVWTAMATEKLYPGIPAREDRVAAIAAAMNEFEAFQIGITGAATNVSATASVLTGRPKPQGVRVGQEARIGTTTL